MIKDDPEVLAMFREAMNGTLAEHGNQSGENNSRNKDRPDAVNSVSESGGNSNNYWQARIQRDCPGELEHIKAGEKTIMQIRREQGWVSSSTRVTLPVDPRQAAELNGNA